jgi:hypothetical protein
MVQGMGGVTHGVHATFLTTATPATSPHLHDSCHLGICFGLLLPCSLLLLLLLLMVMRATSTTAAAGLLLTGSWWLLDLVVTNAVQARACG